VVPCNPKILQNNSILTWNHGFSIIDGGFTHRWEAVGDLSEPNEGCESDTVVQYTVASDHQGSLTSRLTQQQRKKDQLTLTEPRDALYHGERAANKLDGR